MSLLQYTVVRCHKGQGHRGQNGPFENALAGPIEDTGVFWEKLSQGSFFRIVLFTKMHINKLLQKHEVLIRHTFKVLISI